MSAHDYYKLLGVSHTETLEGIQTAYRKLAKQCHPDVVGLQGKEKFQALQEAYEVLSDPSKRKEYDASVDQQRVRRKAHSVQAEPLVPSHYPQFTCPEPLTKFSSPPTDMFGSQSSGCPFCENFRRDLASSCPFCQGFEITQTDIRQFIMNCFRAFRFERF